MDDAGLERRGGEDGRQGLAHALEPIGHRDEDVLAAARLQIGEDLEPEFRPFRLLDPDPQHVARAVREDRQGELDGLTAHGGLVANLTRNASKNTTGYSGSSGRLCHAVTSVTTASVTVQPDAGNNSATQSTDSNPFNPVKPNQPNQPRTYFVCSFVSTLNLR
jgi:hypothetical protein